MNNHHTDRLISRYLDALASPEEMAQLDAWVRNDPDVCRALLRLAAQDARIQSIVAQESAARAFVAHGMVVTTQGTVVCQNKGAELNAGDVLRPGDRVITGADGYLKYAYLDGTVIGVRPNSDFELIPGASLFAKAIRVVRGMLDATVSKQPADARMTFAMPHGMVTMMGTILRVNGTPERSEVNVHSGMVAVDTGARRELVAAGEMAVASEDGLSKARQPELVAPEGAGVYADGTILFQDSFEHGLSDWILYAKKGEGVRAQKTDATGSPDIRVISSPRDGLGKPVAALTGTEPEGCRVGIGTKPIPTACRDFSLSYEYTYSGRQRLAMEGINIDINWEKNSPPFLNGTFKQKARPAGEWNQVRWECIWKMDQQGNPVLDSHLFFNGQFLARRSEFGYMGKILGLVLEVVEGEMLFDHVVIREMNRVPRSATAGAQSNATDSCRGPV